MDKDFKNKVRFKDFGKFVKAYRKKRMFGDADSSYSDSDVLDDVIKELWMKMDPDRTCAVTVEHCADFIAKNFLGLNGGADQTITDLVKEGADKNSDGKITFKEFKKFIEQTFKSATD